MTVEPDNIDHDKAYWKKYHYDNDVKRFKEYWAEASWQTLCNFRDFAFFRGATTCTHPTFFLHEDHTNPEAPETCRLGQEFEMAWEAEYGKRLSFMRNEMDQYALHLEVEKLQEEASERTRKLKEDMMKKDPNKKRVSKK